MSGGVQALRVARPLATGIDRSGGGQLLGGQHAEPRGCQLQSERNAVEPVTNLGNGRDIVCGQFELRLSLHGAIEKKMDCLILTHVLVGRRLGWPWEGQ
jgi:hypothetical protein